LAQAAVDTAALDGFGGELLRDGDPGYDERRRVFNAAIDRKPALIARCTGVADVIAALGFARERSLPVSVRGGAHSVAGHAVLDGGVMIDLRQMNRVRVDPEERIAWCGGGANWGELDRETQAFGLAVTGGRMADTGVGGLTLGGGSGWLERKYGFTVDSLLSAEVVTADGSLVVASADRNPDLFWALKGGGGNFGVVTGFEFALHEVGPLVYGGMLIWPGFMAGEVTRAYRDYMADAPDEVGGGLALITAPPEPFVPEEARGKPAVGIIFTYAGDPEEGERAAAPLRAIAGGPAVDLCGPIPYVGAQKLIEPGNQPGHRNYWKADLLDELPDDAIDTIAAMAPTVPSPFSTLLFQPLGGAVARVAPDATALGRRDAKWAYHLISMWDGPEEDERNIAWTRELFGKLAPYAAGGVYMTFTSDTTDERARDAVGANYERLVAVKDKYDPGNMFRLGPNIRPSAEATARAERP